MDVARFNSQSMEYLATEAALPVIGNHADLISCFQAKETGTPVSIADVISGAIYTPSNLSAIGNGIAVGENSVHPTTGPFVPNLGTSDFFFWAVGARTGAAGATFGFGDPHTFSFPTVAIWEGGASGNFEMYAGGVAGVPAQIPVTSMGVARDTALHAFGVLGTWSGPTLTIRGFVDTTATATATGNVGAINWQITAPVTTFYVVHMQIYQIGLFKFSSVTPTVDFLKGFLLWRKHYAPLGNKAIYPLFPMRRTA